MCVCVFVGVMYEKGRGIFSRDFGRCLSTSLHAAAQASVKLA